MPPLSPTDLAARYAAAVPLDEYIQRAGTNRELWEAVYRTARVDIDTVARAAMLGGSFRLLVLSEDWCGDAVNSVPIVARLADLSPNLELRVLARDEHLDVMDAHLTSGTRSIPVVIVLGEHGEELGWWGPRPAELQRWVLGDGQALPKEERYKEARRWYARDRGRTVLHEVLELLERAAVAAAAARR